MKNNKCDFCEHGGKDCPESFGYPRYRCTREKGHAGPHAACGTLTHILLIWDDAGKIIGGEDQELAKRYHELKHEKPDNTPEFIVWTAEDIIKREA